MKTHQPRTSVPALKTKQWLSEWNEIQWGKHEHGREPVHWFYQFSMPARALKALCGIYPRSTRRSSSAADLGIQRKHEISRSNEIRDYVRYGYPWSDLSDARRRSGEYQDLRQPGWLPTAIVVNILTADDVREGKRVDPTELIDVIDRADGNYAELQLPTGFSGPSWRHQTIPPIEVIDGQHRLWAFDGEELNGDFDLPVVAFLGLDIRWQAYLFYTINIKPKKINASLAFDLYPLLRTQEWLTKFEGHVVYRETRAQELVDLLWSHPASPWHRRINMLGEKGHKGRMVTQAAWVRSLLASFIKSWEGASVRVGGLFGSAVGQHQTVLPWTRTEQAALLIVAGQEVQHAIRNCSASWAEALRKAAPDKLFDEEDLAFYGPNSLLNQDQGIRILLQVLNDLLYVSADSLSLNEWGGQQNRDGADEESVTESIAALRQNDRIIQYLTEMARALATFDWRSSDAPGLTPGEKTLKASFRGSGGYKELRKNVLFHIAQGDSKVARAAAEVAETMGYMP